MNTTEIIWNAIYCIGLFLILWGAVVELFSVEETKPTGVTKVLYENNMGITLVKETYHDWVILSSIHTLDRLMNDCGRYFVAKGDAVVPVPYVTHTEFVEKTEYEPDTTWKYETNVRVIKATLVEEEYTFKLCAGTHESRPIKRKRSTKMVIEYEVTNKDEIERRKLEKQQNTETLQQFVTMEGEE